MSWKNNQIKSSHAIRHWLIGGLGCSLGIALVIVSLTTGIPAIAVLPLAIISTLVTLALGAPSWYQAGKKLFQSGSLNVDSLFALSSFVVLAVSIAAVFVPWLPMMFEVGLLIFGFRYLFLAVQEKMERKISAWKFQSSEKTPLEEKIRRLPGLLVPAIIAVSILSGIAVGMLISPLTGVHFFVSMLLIAYPTYLGLIAPFALKIGISRAAAHQIQFPDSRTLEEIEQTEIVVFNLCEPLTAETVTLYQTLINSLKGMGKDFYLCTNDEGVADSYALALNIPRSKVAIVSNEEHNSSHTLFINILKDTGKKVAFVNHRTHYHPTRSAADYNFVLDKPEKKESLNKTNEVSITRLESILSAFELSRQTAKHIKHTIKMSLGLNLTFVLTSGIVLLACGIALNPAIAVALMAIQTTVLFINVYRFKNQSLAFVEKFPGQQLPFQDSSNHLMLQHMPKIRPEPGMQKETEAKEWKTDRKNSGSPINRLPSPRANQDPVIPSGSLNFQ